MGSWNIIRRVRLCDMSNESRHFPKRRVPILYSQQKEPIRNEFFFSSFASPSLLCVYKMSAMKSAAAAPYTLEMEFLI